MTERTHVFLNVLNLKLRSTPLPLGVSCQRPFGRSRGEREAVRDGMSELAEKAGWMVVVVIGRFWVGGRRM
jgi:hypothetical protein